MKRLIRFGDYAGMMASALCLVHCLATPLLVALFPMLGLAHEHDTFHNTLLAAISLPVLLSLLPGYLRHRDRAVLVLGMLGLSSFLSSIFILSPVYGEQAETVGAVFSGVLLLCAHIRNRRFCTRCAAPVLNKHGRCASAAGN